MNRTYLARSAQVIVATAAALGIATAAPAVATGSESTKKPSVAYTHVSKKKCTTYTVDNEPQEQCQDDFTVSVKGLSKGDKVEVFSNDQQTGNQSEGVFTASSASLKHRFTHEVISYGKPRKPIYETFQVQVKDASGKTIVKTKPHRF